MACTRVLHASTAGLTADLAMHLTQGQPLYQLLSMAPLNPTRCPYPSTDCPQKESLDSTHLSSTSSTSPSGLRSCLRRYGGGVSKKRVVFADTKGLALTAVRLFVPEPPSSTLTTRAKPQLCISSRLQHRRLHLGFTQPTLDFQDFLSRLREKHVQLESCCVSEDSISGKVYTSHSSTESAVRVRVTFDSWRSHHDIPCMFLQQQRCGILDVNIFTFDISLPPNVDPKEKTEFWVSLRPSVGSMLYFDDNRGQNYGLHVENDWPGTTQSTGSRYYSMLSRYRPPCWPSNLVTKVASSTSDWLYVQRSSINNGKRECKTST